MTASDKPRVILIREWENQMSSSGCCGRLEGDFLVQNGERCFPERREIMESMGPLYRDLKEHYGDTIELHVVDPRNMAVVFGFVLKELMARRVGLLQALRTLSGISITSVVVNGRLVSRGYWPTIHDIREILPEPEVAHGIA